MSKRERKKEADTPFSFRDPEQAGFRTVRLQHLLFEEIDRLFRLEVTDPRLQGVIPTSLQLSPDLRNAKVMFGVKQAVKGGKIAEQRQEKRIQEGLLTVTPFLRARVADALAIKRTPDLHFHRDRIAEGALRAARILTREAGKQAAPDQEKDPGPDPPG